MAKHFEISASLVCANFYDLKNQIDDINESGVDYLHFDVMDGVFVPRYGLFPEVLAQIKDHVKVPVDVHMMVVNPEPYIDIFAKSGADIFYVQAEGNNNLHRTILKIKNAGMKPGVVLNIATAAEVLDYILDDISYIMLMGINPGILGHKIIPAIYQKIRDVKKKIGTRNIKILIDGGVTPDTAAEMIRCGADILVCGSSTIFKPAIGTISENTRALITKVERELGKE